ncbi:hypothetical protein Bhyg_08685 [Pseudolycoriella hygida]|uniref:Uncharacterized protein n=1 Tax=Pseudolycoriella hygida TaxID=35572 RepID=A0A9Q0S521_9DIPT|nr:hypothetical protein Bhyg_08685 [Pseudolycoriella hygida]
MCSVVVEDVLSVVEKEPEFKFINYVRIQPSRITIQPAIKVLPYKIHRTGALFCRHLQSKNVTCSNINVIILAAAYAYFEPYRCVALNSVDKIYEIAISLAQNQNIKKANKLRATLMCTLFEKNNCNMVVSNVVLNALKNTPSCSEIYKFKLEDLSVSLEFFEKTYALFGVALYQPPTISGDTGHYVAAVKLSSNLSVLQ